MKNYPVGTAVTLRIPLIDLNGDPVTPTGLFARVTDEHGVERVPEAEVAVSEGATDVEFTVPASANALPDGAVDGARTVTIRIETDAGTFTSEETYLLLAPVRLVIMDNSFQTYEQAVLEASRIPGLEGFAGASKVEQTRALMEAYRRLTKLGYRVRRPEDVDPQNVMYELGSYYQTITPRRWDALTLDHYLTQLPEPFRQALRRAQVVEANEILRHDPIGEKRRAGLLSESIGESSMMFRSGVRPLDLGVSTAALNELAGYVEMRMTLTRA